MRAEAQSPEGLAESEFSQHEFEGRLGTTEQEPGGLSPGAAGEWSGGAESRRARPGSGPGAPTAPEPKARILVVDDHPLVRDGLARLIGRQSDLSCCGEAGTVAEAQSAVARHKPDLVILDLRLRGGDGLELIKSLKAQFPSLRILVLSQHDSPMYVERALRAGALGYVAKDHAAAEVLSAIRTVLAGEVYLAGGMGGLLLHRFVGAGAEAARAGVEQLTDRELHVLQSLGDGRSTREIAAELNLSFKTIQTHRENIKRKLGVRRGAELLHYWSEWVREQLPPLEPEEECLAHG